MNIYKKPQESQNLHCNLKSACTVLFLNEAYNIHCIKSLLKKFNKSFGTASKANI